MNLLPRPADIVTEAITVVAGALLAALLVGQLPGLREWIAEQWRAGKEIDE